MKQNYDQAWTQENKWNKKTLKEKSDRKLTKGYTLGMLIFDPTAIKIIHQNLDSLY